jgi:serine/threonine protein kinase
VAKVGRELLGRKEDEADAWQQAYEELLNYVDMYGDADVATSYQSETGFKLGKWVSQQRTRRNRRGSPMTETQERRLERLPSWTWDKQQLIWDRHYEALEQFIERRQHARVPRSHKETVGSRTFSLGQWVHNQRKAMKAGTLDKRRENLLNQFHLWEWEVELHRPPTTGPIYQTGRTSDFHRELERFVEEYGHALVPKNYRRTGAPPGELGVWVADQREKYASGDLHPILAKQVEVFAGWVWDKDEAEFQTHLYALRQFINRVGNPNVPAGHEELYIGQQIPLASWLAPIMERIYTRNLKGEADEQVLNFVYQWLRREVVCPSCGFQANSGDRPTVYCEQCGTPFDLEKTGAADGRLRLGDRNPDQELFLQPTSPDGSREDFLIGRPAVDVPGINPGRTLEAEDPKQFGPWLLTSRIGGGGQGDVYFGMRPSGDGGRYVAAIKTLKTDQRSDEVKKERLFREAHCLKEIDSPHVPMLLDSDLTADSPWLAMEYLDGKDLAKERAKGLFTDHKIGELALGAAYALRDTHQAGVIHRDVKPHNLVKHGDKVMLVDYGISLSETFAAGLTPYGLQPGTQGYESPEEQKTAASDIFSWAKSVWWLKNGHPNTPPQYSDLAVPVAPSQLMRDITAGKVVANQDVRFEVTGSPINFSRDEHGHITFQLFDTDFVYGPGGIRQEVADFYDIESWIDEGEEGWILDEDRGWQWLIPKDPTVEPSESLQVTIYGQDLSHLMYRENRDLESDLQYSYVVTVYGEIRWRGGRPQLLMSDVNAPDQPAHGPLKGFEALPQLSELMVRALNRAPGPRPTALEIIEVLEDQ